MRELMRVAGGAPVRGDLLSCYSTAVAGLLRTVGVPDVLALGSQLLLGVRRVDGLTEFLHHHTPLAGGGALYPVELRRRGAADAASAADQITEQAHRTGTVLVTGCTTHLAWIGTGQVEPAPHWFLVHPAGGSGSDLLVEDRFTWIDEAGEHPGFGSPLPAREVGRLAWSPRPASPEQASRERWALGDRRERPEWSDDLPWQWLEVDAGPHHADETELGRALLARTVEGLITDETVAAHGWITGAPAYRFLAGLLAEGLSDPASYRGNNDLWVAARNRQMLAVSLRHAELARVASGLSELGEWVDSELTPAWTALVRAMRYNALRVARGSRPRRGVLDELQVIATLEDQFRARLGDAL